MFSYYFQWANCSVKTCSYTLKTFGHCEWGVLFHLGPTLTFEGWKQITLDEVTTSLEQLLKAFFFLFLTYCTHISFGLEYLSGSYIFWIYLHIFYLMPLKPILLALAEDCQWPDNFLWGKRGVVLRVGFHFHRWEKFAKCPLG